jgi:hypothetical protein
MAEDMELMKVASRQRREDLLLGEFVKRRVLEEELKSKTKKIDTLKQKAEQDTKSMKEMYSDTIRNITDTLEKAQKVTV